MQQLKSLSDTKVKILMLGESGVGKSSILLRFADDKFQQSYVVTLGVEYKQKKQKINEKEVLIQVWDTAGQEQFRTITPIYYKNVDGVVVVYDITDERSYESFFSFSQIIVFKVLIIECKIFRNKRKKINDPKIVCTLVGNKCDMADKRNIAKERGEEMVKQYQNILDFCEASAKNDINIQQIFVKLTNEILRRREEGLGVQPLNNSYPLQSNPSKKKSKGKCCGGGSKKNK